MIKDILLFIGFISVFSYYVVTLVKSSAEAIEDLKKNPIIW